MTSKQNDAAEASYRGLIEDLSPVLPHNLAASDITLTPADLAIVLAHYGAADLVADALYEAAGTGDADTFDALAVRVTMPLDAAITSCGLAVVTAVTKYAAKQVYEDVELYRTRQAEEREFERAIAGRRESDASYYGVASVFAPRNGVAP